MAEFGDSGIDSIGMWSAVAAFGDAVDNGILHVDGNAAEAFGITGGNGTACDG